MTIDRFAEWLSRQRAGNGAGEASGLWALALAVAIAVASALTVASVHQQVDARRRDQLALAGIEQLARQLQKEERRPELGLPGTDGTIAEARSALRLALVRLDTTGSESASVREAGTSYLDEASRYFRLVRTGLWGEAWEAGRRSERAYDLLLDAIRHASDVYDARAGLWLQRADLGSTLAIIAEALLIGFLVLSTERGRRAHERRLAAERERQEARFRALVQSSSDVTAVLGPSREVLYLSPAIHRVLGYAPEAALGRDGFESLHPEDLPTAEETFARVLEEPDAVLLTEARLRHADGSWRWVEINSANLLADPNVQGIVLNLRDVSERKALEEQLRHQALHDPLTGLANRALLSKLLVHTLAGAPRRQRQITVFYIDLDDFKRINDTLGHEAGDQLLIQVAQRLRASVRMEDTPARLGGDELAVLAEGLSRREAADLALRLLADLAPPFRLAGQSITVGASVGVAQAGPEDTAEDLLRNADTAMYVAKTSGKGRFAIFDKAMREKPWGSAPKRRPSSAAA
jgi:diguanylate cyclase (GGDEF)-like protein/PAS domain S-box-containing protein